jgi:carnitine-CoA ligase
MLDRHARERPDREFVVFAEESWTYAQAAERAWQRAHALVGKGVQPGESVSVWGPAGPGLVEAWLGANAAGAVYAPLHLAARGAFLEHALNLAESRVLVAQPGLVERLEGLDLRTLEHVVVMGEAPDADLARTRPVLSAPREPWDDFAIVYTSGTSGPSKGVRLSYASQRLYADSLVLADIGESDRLLMALPLSHVAGTAATYAMLQRGGTIVLPGAFDAGTFWDIVRRYRATATFVLHGMVSLLLDQPPRDDDADNPLRYVYMGPLARSGEFRARFGVQVYTGFGMTELPVVLRSELNPANEKTIGRPFNPDYECRLVDEHDLPVADGAVGELIVRHKQPWVVNSGYKNMPEATAAAWRNGWFHTGDLMRVDGSGDWVFVDRAKDSIRRRGENISSYDVEAAVLSHEDIEDAAAVGVPNPDIEAGAGEEEVKIVVVPVKGRDIDPLELTEYLVPRLPRYMVPRFIEVAGELPRSPSFKVKKAELRAAGITPGTFDRVRAGARLAREQLG